MTTKELMSMQEFQTDAIQRMKCELREANQNGHDHEVVKINDALLKADKTLIEINSLLLNSADNTSSEKKQEFVKKNYGYSIIRSSYPEII